MKKTILITTLLSLLAGSVFASGFGVFTQGASALGQANAVVAHPVGPSSLYFNPALLNDIPGRQIEIGTTGIYADRTIQLDSGGTEEGDNSWNFPSNAYYTHQVNESLSTGLGLFFPFGLSTEWDENYEGRYLGTSGEITTLNINPVISYRLNEKLSVAAGFSLVYLDATLKKKINQTAAYVITDLQLSGGTGGALPPLTGDLNDISQKFEGEGWGHGFNLGVLYKPTDRISVGATYRSHIDINVKGRATFNNVDSNLAMFIPDTNGSSDIRLPAQATAGIAFTILPSLIVEVGVRWEDWSSTEELKVELDNLVLGQSADIIPRDWKSTWSYNIGGQYRVNETFALNAGYLYGENTVPDSTFEPLIPDTDAHLFTFGVEWTYADWTAIAAFGYEHHTDRNKTNSLGDPLGSILAGQPTDTANGRYETDIYLTGLSVIYKF
ncbi:MAG: outer membrane protein transport protein [Desulfuromusa sp.]|nr:outer membrane protein transport protein [Desulfuromusa sp.]